MNKEIKNSPEHVRTSLAGAMSLGLRPGRFYRDADLYCLNLLLTYDEGCQANCAYCGLSRSAQGEYDERSFIRVEWPSYTTDDILSRACEKRDSFERVCLSMITHPRALEDTITLTARLHGELGLPVSVLVNPTRMGDGDLEALKEAGAEMASIALDAATPSLFAEYRGEGVKGPHKVDRYWSTLNDAALVFGREKVGCHLIAGLGETEKSMLETVQKIRSIGARSHLFSFFPETGSPMERADPCPPDHFRRVQLARFLIDYDAARFDDMEFDEHDRVVGFGVRGAELDRLVDSGVPFMTSGCPGKTRECACNRPFGDGPPSDIRSYPFNLNEEDILTVRKQLATYPEVPSRETLDVSA
jgi:biotin synthase